MDAKEIALRIVLKLIDKGLLQTSDDPASASANAYGHILKKIQKQLDQADQEARERTVAQEANRICAEIDADLKRSAAARRRSKRASSHRPEDQGDR